MLKVTVHNGDALSIIEALDAIESLAHIVHANPLRVTLHVEGNEGDARNVLGQFGYDNIQEVDRTHRA
jgi:hypothetical protein